MSILSFVRCTLSLFGYPMFFIALVCVSFPHTIWTDCARSSRTRDSCFSFCPCSCSCSQLSSFAVFFNICISTTQLTSAPAIVLSHTYFSSPTAGPRSQRYLLRAPVAPFLTPFSNLQAFSHPFQSPGLTPPKYRRVVILTRYGRSRPVKMFSVAQYLRRRKTMPRHAKAKDELIG